MSNHDMNLGGMVATNVVMMKLEKTINSRGTTRIEIICAMNFMELEFHSGTSRGVKGLGMCEGIKLKGLKVRK